ncbi:hypothetical protein Bca52824_073534 [Brassica carinata]|uniref:Uncharacterized protein n=1 Tax=Brassica carinata TaxID=52824 RepID=A0A8X7QD76_BRACI|nr:hypothetical protein Bca52824_073534 [Brassica carinata]
MATKMWRFGWLGEEVLKVCVSTHKSFTFCEAQMFEETIVVQTWLGLMTRSRLQIQLLVYIDLSLCRKVDFDRFILLSKWKRMVLSVVSHYRDDFNFGYDRKRKSSQVSMLVLELKKEAVSNYGLTVLNSFKLCWLLVWSGLYMLVPYCEAIV